MTKDIFGEPLYKKTDLRAEFLEPPFSILDAKSGSWNDRKRMWKSLGIQSEEGRDAAVYNLSKSISKFDSQISIFDPALCELMYKWFCPAEGNILDPFAGGSVRGIVAQHMGYNYTGIDIREVQVESNRQQAEDILEPDNHPTWICGDSLEVLKEGGIAPVDFVFSCPPYANLETYSDLPNDISNMDYKGFLKAYREIIRLAVSYLVPGGYAAFVVGEVRDKKGNYIGFVPATIRAFEAAGMKLYNEAILLTPIGTACMRAKKQFTNSKKLAKIHQNVLVFRKQQ